MATLACAMVASRLFAAMLCVALIWSSNLNPCRAQEQQIVSSQQGRGVSSGQSLVISQNNQGGIRVVDRSTNRELVNTNSLQLTEGVEGPENLVAGLLEWIEEKKRKKRERENERQPFILPQPLPPPLPQPLPQPLPLPLPPPHPVPHLLPLPLPHPHPHPEPHRHERKEIHIHINNHIKKGHKKGHKKPHDKHGHQYEIYHDGHDDHDYHDKYYHGKHSYPLLGHHLSFDHFDHSSLGHHSAGHGHGHDYDHDHGHDHGHGHDHHGGQDYSGYESQVVAEYASSAQVAKDDKKRSKMDNKMDNKAQQGATD